MVTKEWLIREIKDPKYDVLRQDENLKRTMLLTIGGSLAYGTNIDTKEHVSDLDLRGICGHTREEIMGMNCVDKPYEWHDDERDVVIYTVKQIMKLLCSCNPNVIEILGTLDEHLIYCDARGKLIRDNRDLFLSQRAFYTFGGMARNNLRLMKNILYKTSLTPKDKAQFTVDSLAVVLNNALDKYNTLVGQDLRVGVNDRVDSDSYLDYITINGELKDMGWFDFKGVMGELNNVIRGYDRQTLTKRNAKKDQVHLYKHIMHTIRTLKMGTEILSGKGMNVYREEDRDFLLDIRNGVYSTDELFEMTDKLEAELEYAKNNTVLPKEVDMKKVKDITMEITKMTLDME